MSASFAGWRHPLPQFRGDLPIVRLGLEGRRTMHYVRDPKTSEVIEFGEEGAFICRQLDGRTGPGEIRRRFEARFGTPVGEDDLDVFVEQLAHKGMLEGIAAGPRLRTFAEYLDPEVFLPRHKIPLLSGDRVIGAVARHLEWLFSWPVHLLFAAVFVWAAVIYAERFTDLIAAVMSGMTLGFFLLVVFSSCLLIHSPRAILHGIMCERYGRRVTVIGLAILYYVLPIVYCDWSDAAWVADKRRRFWGVAAGIYYQVGLWAVSTICWQQTRPGGWPNTFWLNLSFATALGFLLFVANPLVKMSGYLLLVHWIDVARLRERALAAFGSWVQLRRPSEVFTARERRWFIVYGLLVFGYAMLHLALIAYFAWGKLTPLYAGRGALATLGLILFLVHKPLVEILGRTAPVRWLLDRRGGPLRWGVRLAIPAALAGILFLPYPYRTGGAFQLLPARRVEVHSEIEGVIEAVLVREGQAVTAGQPIARVAIRSPETDLQTAVARLQGAQADLALLEAGAKPEEIERALTEVQTARIRVASSRATATRYIQMFAEGMVSQQAYENVLNQRDMAIAGLDEAEADLEVVRSGARPEQIQAKKAEIASLQAVVDNDTVDVERTVLVSPIAGRVVTPRVEELAGTYLEPGQRDLVAVIEDGSTATIEVAVPEQDAADVRVGNAVEVVPWGFHATALAGRVVGIAPVAVANQDAASAPVTAAALGPVAVPGMNSAGGRVVRVTTEIPNPRESLKTDMTGYAKIAVGDRPLWDVISRPLVRWCMVEVWSWIP
jgi:multidrug resistance efflux pump